MASGRGIWRPCIYCRYLSGAGARKLRARQHVETSACPVIDHYAAKFIYQSTQAVLTHPNNESVQPTTRKQDPRNPINHRSSYPLYHYSSPPPSHPPSPHRNPIQTPPTPSPPPPQSATSQTHPPPRANPSEQTPRTPSPLGLSTPSARAHILSETLRAASESRANGWWWCRRRRWWEWWRG